MNKTGYFPYTPSTNLLYGLSEALDMLEEEGLETVFARHRRWSAGVRGAVDAWGLPVQCADAALHSPILTGVIVPAGVDADALRKTILERFDLSLGAGLGKAEGPHVPHRPSRQQQRSDPAGDSGGLRNGLAAGGREFGGQRRRFGDGLFRRPSYAE